MPVYTLALLWRWPSPVRRQTANLVLYELGGSNPPLHAILPSGCEFNFESSDHIALMKASTFSLRPEQSTVFWTLDGSFVKVFTTNVSASDDQFTNLNSPGRS